MPHKKLIKISDKKRAMPSIWNREFLLLDQKNGFIPKNWAGKLNLQKYL